jgi:hypothetical protein
MPSGSSQVITVGGAPTRAQPRIELQFHGRVAQRQDHEVERFEIDLTPREGLFNRVRHRMDVNVGKLPLDGCLQYLRLVLVPEGPAECELKGVLRKEVLRVHQRQVQDARAGQLEREVATRLGARSRNTRFEPLHPNCKRLLASPIDSDVEHVGPRVVAGGIEAVAGRGNPSRVNGSATLERPSAVEDDELIGSDRLPGALGAVWPLYPDLGGAGCANAEVSPAELATGVAAADR